jgi:hypothetical protein
MVTLAFIPNISIRRDDPEYPGRAVVLDSDGDVLWHFRADWTDEQIQEALGWANDAFRVGYGAGRAAKVQEIRKALEIA